MRLLAMAVALAAWTARAQDAVGGAPMDDGGSLGWVLLRTLLVLGFVVLLAYIALNFGLRRLMGLTRFSAGKEPLVRIVERVPLEPKRSLYVVEAAGEYLLIGATEGGIGLLGKLPKARSPDAPAPHLG